MSDFGHHRKHFELEIIERIVHLGLDFFDDSFINQGFIEIVFV